MAISSSRGRYAPIPRPQIGAYHTSTGAIANYDQFGQVIPRDPVSGQLILGQGQRDMGATPPARADRAGDPADNLRDEMFGRGYSSQQAPVTPAPSAQPPPNYLGAMATGIGTLTNNTDLLNAGRNTPSPQAPVVPAPAQPTAAPGNPYAAGTHANQVWNDMETHTNGYEGHPGMMAGRDIGTVTDRGASADRPSPLTAADMQRIERQYAPADSAGFKTPIAGNGPGTTSSGAPAGYLGPAATTIAQGGLLPNPVAAGRMPTSPQQAGQNVPLALVTPGITTTQAPAPKTPYTGRSTPVPPPVNTSPGYAAGQQIADIPGSIGAMGKYLGNKINNGVMSAANVAGDFVNGISGNKPVTPPVRDPMQPVSPIGATPTPDANAPVKAGNVTMNPPVAPVSAGNVAFNNPTGQTINPKQYIASDPLASGAGAFLAQLPDFLKKKPGDGQPLSQGNSANLSGQPNYAVSQ